MIFFQKAKKFLYPLLQSKKYLFLSCAKFIFWAFYSIVIVLLIKNTTEAITEGNLTHFHNSVIYFSIFIVIYFFVNYIGREWEWPKLYYVTEQYISDTYVRKLMAIDNNYIESIGSGKLVSIMQNVIKRWNENLSFLIRDLTRTCIIFIVTVYILYSMNHLYG